MRRISSILLLLLGDERSAIRRNTAFRFSLVVLVTAVMGLLLLSFGEQTYRDFDRRVLRASQDLTSGPLI
jgi:hypothetical protein